MDNGEPDAFATGQSHFDRSISAADTSPESSQQSSRSSTPLSQQPISIESGTPPPRAASVTLERAIDEFRRRVNATELIEFRETTYRSLCEKLLKVQERQEARLETMNLARIKHCLEAMHQFGQVIEIFLNVSDAIAFVWGPMKFLLLTASTFADSFDSLLDAYERIGEQLPRLAGYHSLFSNSPHMIDALVLIYIDILDFHQQACKFFSGRLWVRFFKSMWKNFHTRFNGILSSLRRHKDIVECRANLAQYRIYQDDVASFKAKLEESVMREETKNLMIVKEWLSVGELPQLDHASYCKVRADYATTTKWISQHKTVKHWIHADIPKSPVVWMYGIPGAGKTILTSAIIDECKTRSDFITCYFYCHDGDPTSSTAVGILKGLADQLLDQYPDMLPPCFTRRRSSGEPSLRSIIHAKKLLEDFCNAIPKLFIVIDGLDECEKAERNQVLDILTEVVGFRDTVDPGTLRLLVASQDLVDIRRGLNSFVGTEVAPTILRISETDNEGDIRAFTRLWVDKIASKFPPFSEDMKEYLQNRTVVNAKGMFLYAKLVLSDFYASTTLAELKDAIKTENFPLGIVDTYERILKDIKTSSAMDWPKTLKILGWLVCAKRSLTWKEIQVALSIDSERQLIDYDNQRARDHIYVTCGSLVHVSGDRVSLVHSTAKTYITTITKDIHEPSIECELATLCMQYLTFPCFDVDNPDDVVQRRRFVLDGSLAFQDYAIANWFRHVNAWVENGARFLEEAVDQPAKLQQFSMAMEEFMSRYNDVFWKSDLLGVCKAECRVFEHHGFFEDLVRLTSHIRLFQQKGFESQHKISINDLYEAMRRNRLILEVFPDSDPSPNPDEIRVYRTFYDEERRFKCTRITCRYFSEGFKDDETRRRHVNIHERPFQCDIPDCVGAEGFVNAKDLEKHTRTFHPEKSDLAETFASTVATKRGNTNYACSICGKAFSRSYHRRDHELSHTGERPHECADCGKAFTRLNDLKRHQRVHERVDPPDTGEDLENIKGVGSATMDGLAIGKFDTEELDASDYRNPSTRVSSAIRPFGTGALRDYKFPRSITTISTDTPILSSSPGPGGWDRELIPLVSGKSQSSNATKSYAMDDFEGTPDSRGTNSMIDPSLAVVSSFPEPPSVATSSGAASKSQSIFDKFDSATASSIPTAPDSSIVPSLPRVRDTKSKPPSPIMEEITVEREPHTQDISEDHEVVETDISNVVAVNYDCMSLVSNDESIGSQAFLERRPAEFVASKYLGQFLGDLSELRPLHEVALHKLGRERFVRNYGRLLKNHLLRLRKQTKPRTPVENVTFRFLSSRSNRLDVAQNIVEALEPSPEEDLEQDDRENQKPDITQLIFEGELDIMSWVNNEQMPKQENSTDREQTPELGVDPSDTWGETQIEIADSDNEYDDTSSCDDKWEDTSEINFKRICDEFFDISRGDLLGIESDLWSLIMPGCLMDVLDTVPVEDISISYSNDTSIINKVKAFIEDHTPFEWDWWPLRPRSHNLPLGRQRVLWKTSWHFYSQDVADADAHTLQMFLDRSRTHPPMCYCCRGGTTAESKDKMTCMSKLYGSVAMATAYCLVLDLVEVLVTVAAWFTQIVKSSTKQPLSMPTIPPPLLTRPSSARTRFTPSTVSNVTTTTTSPQVVPSASLTQQTPNSSSGSSSQAQTYPSNAPVPLQPYDPSWVVIGIPSWALLNIKDQIYHDEIENIDMSSTLMNDTTFFAELRRLDDKYRWPVLKWLSPWIFTHCKFVRFDSHDIRLTYCWGESLPEDGNAGAHYEYHPRPPGVDCSDKPPINRNEFGRHLRSCKDSCLWARLRLLKHRCLRTHISSHIWRRIPRKRGSMEENAGDIAYGIEAVYTASAVMMFWYHAVPVFGWGCFSFWWLRHHPDDLQNAFIPLVTFLAIVAAFWSYPGSGRGT